MPAHPDANLRATPDHDMPARLRSAAADLGGERSLSDALAIAALAAERRLGVWEAALARPDAPSGGQRAAARHC